MDQVKIISSPAIDNCLSYLRDKNTDVPIFKKYGDDIATAMGFELAKDLPLISKEIETPLSPITVQFTSTHKILLVAVLRSGYPLCLGIQHGLPDATIALIDIKRDETTAQPHLNYDGVPQSLDQFDQIIIPDPMLATGGSACMTIDILKKRGAQKILFLSLISAPEGINKIKNDFPDVDIVTCAVDSHLNEKKYIVPGLGDFGDRYFGDNPVSISDKLNHKTLNFQNSHFILSDLF